MGWQQRVLHRSAPKLVNAASLLQEVGVRISVIYGIQTNVPRSRLSLGGGLPALTLETLQLIFPSAASFSSKIQETMQRGNKTLQNELFPGLCISISSEQNRLQMWNLNMSAIIGCGLEK